MNKQKSCDPIAVQCKLVWDYFHKNILILPNESVSSWISQFSDRFREIWDQGNHKVSEIKKELYK